MSKKPKSDYAIQTVSNALRLLETFEREDRLGVTELSRRLGLHKNNVFRLLATLEQSGYIEQCADDDQYRLGVRCLDLGHSYANSRSLLRRARPALEALCRELDETVHLAVREGWEVVHLDGELPDRMLVTSLRVGRRLPLHATALGKVLVGGEAERQAFDREVLSSGVEALTPATLVDRDKLIEHLGAVAVRGWAVDWEECAPGLCCAAAPVLAPSGRVVAALSVSAPSSRLTPEELEQRLAPAVVTAAEGLTRQVA